MPKARQAKKRQRREISRVLTLVGIGMGILALPACGGEEDAISTHDQSLRPQVGEVDAESGPDVTPSIVDAPTERPALCLAELQAVESADGDADAQAAAMNALTACLEEHDPCADTAAGAETESDATPAQAAFCRDGAVIPKIEDDPCYVEPDDASEEAVSAAIEATLECLKAAGPPAPATEPPPTELPPPPTELPPPPTELPPPPTELPPPPTELPPPPTELPPPPTEPPSGE